MELGKINKLKIEKLTDIGAYLIDEKAPKEAHVLLPKKQLPEDAAIGDEIRVFLYKDSKDRPIATVNTPLITKGQVAVLSVKEVNKIGAFLDMGLERDLFMPYKEMNGRPEAGDEVLVRMYEDKSHRLSASMKGLYHLLSMNPPYVIGDQVSARIYEFGHDFGTYAAVDDKYSAMIPRHEDVSHLRIGDVISARVTNVKEDGKLDISLRGKAYEEIETDSEKILSLLREYAGVLPFTEKADPAVIKRETGLTKNAFKRAVGHLYKERLIDLSDGKIRLV